MAAFRKLDRLGHRFDKASGGTRASRSKAVSQALVPLCLVLVLWPSRSEMLKKSEHWRIEEALAALRGAFELRDQPDRVFDQALHDSQRLALAISHGGARRWWTLDLNALAGSRAEDCIAYLQTYRAVMRVARFALDTTQGSDPDYTEFDSALVEAEHQQKGAIQSMSDMEGYLRWPLEGK